MFFILKDDIKEIIDYSIESVLPEKSVAESLKQLDSDGPFTVVSIGKAAWRMAHACQNHLGKKIKSGYVITKYGHSNGNITGFEIFEAGHPIPDIKGIDATKHVIENTSRLTESDTVLFLVSGGGSALFESPVDGISLEDIRKLTDELLKSGAPIREINCIRKRLSKVKGGGFLKHVGKAGVITLALSDVLGDDPRTIASGPTVADENGETDAAAILKKYGISVPGRITCALNSVAVAPDIRSEYRIIGSLDMACAAAYVKSRELGYEPCIISSSVDCEAREAGKLLGSIARTVVSGRSSFKTPAAFILGGETVVKIKGSGKGGRNQELALSAAISIDGLEGVAIASVGTDGTDGPTDAAGGAVTGDSSARMREMGISPEEYLENNDSFTALSSCGDIIRTGPTGTNVNDLMLVLCR